jgi:hypothetical protein
MGALLAAVIVVAGAFGVALLSAGVHRVRPAAPVAVPEPAPAVMPKIPRDTSRPYPRPKGHRSGLNRVCPVCGTGRETGDLDGRVLGWAAHRSCAEWLGDWKPPSAEVRELQGALDSFEDHRVPVLPPRPGTSATASMTAQPAISGSGSITVTSYPVASAEEVAAARKILQNGIASPGETRERLNAEIIASWGVPPMMLQEHTHKPGDPVPAVQCPSCGARFIGTPDYLREAYRIHRQAGCRPRSSGAS